MRAVFLVLPISSVLLLPVRLSATLLALVSRALVVRALALSAFD
jgi:hypothetical protein